MQGDNPTPTPSSDSALWRRSRATEARADDAERFLDLAGYADGRLDPDDRERVTEWLADDPAASADVAAARALAAADAVEPISEAAVARACALVGGATPATAEIIPFTRSQRRGAAMQVLARWSSIAAAVAVASWLGFTMGVDTSRSFAPGARSGDDGVLNELLDPSASLLRDLTEGSQT